MLDFRLLVFQRVARSNSFTKAAEDLYITQPAVTKHIKELESEFEIRLFDRVGNKIALTTAGSLLLSYAEQILLLHNDMKFELSQLRSGQEGKLRVGASTTIAQYIIPTALAKFSNRFPEIDLSMLNGNTQFIEELLIRNEIEMGIVEGMPSHSDIRYTPFLEDELVVFTSAQNQILPRTVSNEGFMKLPLVLRERGSGTLEIIEKTIQHSQISPKHLNIIMYLGSTEAIKTFIRTGNGVGIVSRYAIEQELLNNTFRIIHTSGLRFIRKFYFISLKGPDPTGLTKLFLEFLRKYYQLI